MLLDRPILFHLRGSSPALPLPPRVPHPSTVVSHPPPPAPRPPPVVAHPQTVVAHPPPPASRPPRHAPPGVPLPDASIGSVLPGVPTSRPPALPPGTGDPRERRHPRPRVPPPRAPARPVAVLADEPRTSIDLDGFQTLRREGLFADDGRNPPPSWWAR